jgi:hypothetical protein
MRFTHARDVRGLFRGVPQGQTQDQGHPRGTGSPAAALAIMFKQVELARGHWRAIVGAHLVVQVRSGAQFRNGVLVGASPAYAGTRPGVRRRWRNGCERRSLGRLGTAERDRLISRFRADWSALSGTRRPVTALSGTRSESCRSLSPSIGWCRVMSRRAGRPSGRIGTRRTQPDGLTLPGPWRTQTDAGRAEN